MKKNPYLFLIFLLLSACHQAEIQPAFYHWKTNLDIGNVEETYLTETGTQRLYIRLFDVKYNEEKKKAIPVASINVRQLPQKVKEWVPVVFITNRTFVEINENEVQALADSVGTYMQKTMKDWEETRIPEWQFDCDWTKSTKSKFFSFLEKIKKYTNNKTLSATIRLHQIKFRETTGVPPVDRGMLMFYNMGTLKDEKEVNSILNLDIGKQYIGQLKNYPLKLDLALPLFSWGVVKRKGRILHLINNLQEETLNDSLKYEVIEEKQYKVKESHYISGYYLYKNDLIRLERIELDLLNATVELLKNKLPSNDKFITFYHLDSKIIKAFPYENIQNLVDSFR